MSPLFTGWQLTITLEDGKIVEKYKLEDKEWQTVREVADGVMTSVSDYVITINAVVQFSLPNDCGATWGYIACMQG